MSTETTINILATEHGGNTMSEPTLEDRLWGITIGGTRYPDGRVELGAFTRKGLAAIQKQIEDAATAPLRAEVKRVTADRDRWKVRRHDGGRLWSKLRDASRRVYHDSSPNFSTQFALTVAEVNAIEWELLCTYDAADRAGEETPDHDANEAYVEGEAPYDRAGEETPMQKMGDREVGLSNASSFAFEAWRRRDDEALDARMRDLGELLTYKRLDRDPAPSPTDAAEDDPFSGPASPQGWQERMDVWAANASLELATINDRITALVTRADAATSRLDMHMQRLDDAERWIEDVNERLAAALACIAVLEAARTPVPVVTDSDIAALLAKHANPIEWLAKQVVDLRKWQKDIDAEFADQAKRLMPSGQVTQGNSLAHSAWALAVMAHAAIDELREEIRQGARSER